MIEMKIDINNVQQFFFDKQAVMDAVGAAKARVMSRQGSLVRTIMRRSMRRRKGTSEPGQPPFAHTGRIRDNVFFSFDPISDSCVIGPVLLNRSTDAPHTLDKGGYAAVIPRDKKGRLLAIAAARTVQVRIAARPFSEPALENALPYLASEWEDQVGRTG